MDLKKEIMKVVVYELHQNNNAALYEIDPASCCRNIEKMRQTKVTLSIKRYLLFYSAGLKLIWADMIDLLSLVEKKLFT